MDKLGYTFNKKTKHFKAKFFKAEDRLVHFYGNQVIPEVEKQRNLTQPDTTLNKAEEEAETLPLFI